MLRTATLSVFGQSLGYNKIPSVISGKNPAFSSRMLGTHKHAHYLCEPDLKTGEISSILVYIPGPLPVDYLFVFAKISEIWAADFGRIYLEPINEDPFTASILCGSSVRWVSLTPYLLEQHLRIKASEKHDNFIYNQALERELSKQIKRELVNRDLPLPSSVVFDRNNGVALNKELFIPWNKFRRTRSSITRKPIIKYGHGFTIEFEHEVTGPISLGYASHFSLGLFAPAFSF